MRMGSIATNSYCSPDNMLHILLDDNSYLSTGAQATVSCNVDFVNLAAAAGYTNTVYAHGLKDFEHHLTEWKKNKGLTFIYIKTSHNTIKNPGRPKIKPYEVKQRLMDFLGRG